MLGKHFFTISQSLQNARSFKEVGDLLSTELPALIDADAALLIEAAGNSRIVAAYGQGATADLAREHLTELNAAFPDHPLVQKIDFSAPGELGVTVSDFVSPEEYRKCEFNRLLHDGRASDDGIIGKLVADERGTTFLVACRQEGAFQPEKREIFDAILFTARAVLERIGSEGVEAAVRSFLLATAGGAPMALFVVRPSREVLPISHDAIQLAEKWWTIDEAFHVLSADTHRQLTEDVRDAWNDPVDASFQSLRIDLGGGEIPCHAMPKANGEVILIVPVSGRVPSGEDALRAVLTRRQREIMEWIAEGKTSAEAAIILGISPRTVEKHLEAVFQRLGVENRISAVRRFLDLRAGQPV